MKSLSITSNQIRKRILEMSFRGQSVHVPSAFSIVEILKVLHDAVLHYPDSRPDSPQRDIFVLSKGHGVMALYCILENRGWLTEDQLDEYFKDGSSLPGLYEASIPGCEANTGSLGQGLGVATGFALAIKKKRQSKRRVYCLIGDGELNEGSTYEALSFIGHSQLDGMAVIVDLNGFQAMGPTEKVISNKGLTQILCGLGFDVVELDGHSEIELSRTFISFREGNFSKPLAVIAKTTKGRGVSFMENNNSWHYSRLDNSTYLQGLKELES